MFYKFGDTFKWFMGRVVDIKDPKYLGRVKVRVINDQTGEMGKKSIVGGQMPKGLLDEDLLWAWPLSAVLVQANRRQRVVLLASCPPRRVLSVSVAKLCLLITEKELRISCAKFR